MRRAVLTGLMTLLAAGAFTQAATEAQREGVEQKRSYGTVHMASKIGSIRVLQAEGRLEMSFTGTLLVSKHEGDIKFEGKIRKEHDLNDRQVYTGKGKAIITGKWYAVQWFGRDLDAVWYGEGMARLVGEFDEDLKTGFYWYDDPKIKFPWFPTAVTEIYLPPKQPGLSRREPLRVEQKRTKRRQPRKPTTVGNSTADSN